MSHSSAFELTRSTYSSTGLADVSVHHRASAHRCGRDLADGGAIEKQRDVTGCRVSAAEVEAVNHGSVTARSARMAVIYALIHSGTGRMIF